MDIFWRKETELREEGDGETDGRNGEEIPIMRGFIFPWKR